MYTEEFKDVGIVLVDVVNCVITGGSIEEETMDPEAMEEAIDPDVKEDAAGVEKEGQRIANRCLGGEVSSSESSLVPIARGLFL